MTESSMKFLYDYSFVTEEQIETLSTPLLSYIDKLQLIAAVPHYGSNESSINLPFDKSILQEIKNFKKENVSDKLKYIINIGIGGSCLGAKAIYDAEFGFSDTMCPTRFPKMIFMDTNDPEYLANLLSFLKEEIKDPDETIISLISKSGTNTEPLVNFEIIYPTLKNKFTNIDDRIVAITDNGSKLWNLANEKGIKTLSLPKVIGGRYSVFSTVGLFPLLCAGIDINSLLKGARNITESCIDHNVLKNPAFISAAVLYLQLKQGKVMNDNFFFHPELESLGKWYRQLMGESIGKEKNMKGNIVNSGITPTVSIGSIDLHTIVQLYLGGPKDKITTFTYTRSLNKSPKTPQKLYLPGLVDHVVNKSASDIMKAIFESVKTAYTKKALPFMEIVLDDISEKSLGEFMQFKMIEMMYLAKFMNVNGFDQPNVEDYKVETKRILNGKA